MQQQQQQPQVQPINSTSLLTPTTTPPPSMNGLFLGLVEPTKTEANADIEDTAPEDAEYRRAMEAALYAADVIQHEQEQQKKKKGGPILMGFGSILSTTQGLFSPSSSATTSQQPASISLPTPSAQYDIHVDDVLDDDNDSTNRNRLPPWLQSSNQHTNTNTSRNTSQPPQMGEQDEEQKQGTARSAAVVGASVVGAVAGLAVMGPIAGVVAAGGAAYAAATKEGRMGNVLRGTGAVVAKAGVAAQQFEQHHHLVANTASGVAQTVGWVSRRTTQSPAPSTTPTASSAGLTPPSSSSPSPSSFTTTTSTPSSYDETY